MGETARVGAEGLALGPYLKALEGRFVALRGRGYSLSARDVGRVMTWHAEGVPLFVALRVIDEAMLKWRRDGAKRAPTLGGLERSVEAAMKRRAERGVAVALEDAAQAKPSDEWARLKDALAEAGRATQDGGAKAALRSAWREVKGAEAGAGDPWELAAALDERLVVGLGELLPAAERAKMAADVETGLAAVGAAKMSQGARAERAAFEMARWVRAHFAVPELVRVLLEGGLAEEAS